jgi:hypothetical protein
MFPPEKFAKSEAVCSSAEISDAETTAFSCEEIDVSIAEIESELFEIAFSFDASAEFWVLSAPEIN